MLTTSGRGYSLSTLLSRGFAFVMLQRLVGAGLAVAQRDAVGLSKTKVPFLRDHRGGSEGDRGMTPGAPPGSQRQQSGQCRHEDQAEDDARHCEEYDQNDAEIDLQATAVVWPA
jgi:hypothetical protein